jgi:MraZ protein
VFTGEYHQKLDDKGRLAVPIKFREDLAVGARVCKWIDGCVAIFTREDWEALAAKTAALPVSDEGARGFQRFLFASAFEFKLDAQNRFVLPSVLRTFADLGTDVMVVGARNHLEIWSPPRWSQYSAQMDQPEVLAEHLQGLGI